ncbi:hypothetical protein MAR_021281, partial [Mya arenaria]
RPKGPPYISVNGELLEGETVDITCSSSSARPPPLLRFLVEDIVIDTNTNVSTTIDGSTGLYTSVSTLYSFKREWGNKNMTCQQFPEMNGLYHESVSNSVYILYKFLFHPPSRLIIVIEQDDLSKVITASCSSMFANPACNIKWESTIQHFKYTSIENRTFKEVTESKISFSAKNEDHGKQIRCCSECQYFKNTLTNATTVIFSEKPTVVVYSTPVLPVPPNTNITLTCVVNSHPVGNITWTMVESSNSISTQTKTCSNTPACTYEMTTSDVEQVYSCYAQNEHGSDERSIVIVDELRYKEDKTGSDSGSMGVAMVTAGGIALLFVVSVGVPVAERDDVTHAHTGVAEYAVIHGTNRDLENVAPSSSICMHSCDVMNECVENAATKSSAHVEQPSNDNNNENDDGISMQNQLMNEDSPNAESPKRSTNELVYADVDIEHLEKFRVGLRTCSDDEFTEYSDIVFGASSSVKPDSSNENV